jgi:hypothetical protein
MDHVQQTKVSRLLPLLVDFQRGVAEKRMLCGLQMFALFQCLFVPKFLMLCEVGGKNLWPVWLSSLFCTVSGLWVLSVRGLVRMFGSWRCWCRRVV